jgi:hypothetical protein
MATPLKMESNRYNIEVASNSFVQNGKSYKLLGPLHGLSFIALTLIGSAIVGMKETRRHTSKLSHDLWIPCVWNQATY